MQLLVQVLADEGARTDAVDIDPLRLGDGVNRSLQNFQVHCRRGVGDSTRSRMGDLGDNVGQCVRRGNGAGHGCPITMIGFLELCGTR